MSDDTIKLLRAIADSADAKKNKHDIILQVAANELEAFERKAEAEKNMFSNNVFEQKTPEQILEDVQLGMQDAFITKNEKLADAKAWELIDFCAATLTTIGEATSDKLRIYLHRECHVCKTTTHLCCADCRMNFGAYVYVCSNPKCRDEHERKCWGTKE